MNFNANAIPFEMKERKQWVAYFKKEVPGSTHLGKVMVSPITYKHARSNEPSDWSDFYNAQLFATSYRKMDGLAFVLTEGIVFVDIDNSIGGNGKINPIGDKLLKAFPDTYAERSCSGHGIHILMKGRLPKDCMKRNDSIGLEMYDTKRFCCITGDVIDGRTKLLDCSRTIEKVALSLMGRKEVSHTPKPFYGKPLANDRMVIERAMRSKNGAKFQRLYQGDSSGYASQSSADLALVAMISFYTQDPEQIDRIFRTSGLMREKWDSQRGDSTYGRMTIEASLRNTRRVYEMQ